MQALLFAAGLGTRLRPLTDHMPKALVPVAGEPLLAITTRRLKAAGVTDMVINVHHFADQIKDYVAHHELGVNLKISDESRQLLDTGGGLRQALTLFEGDDPILIHNVDILSNADLREFYTNNQNCDVALMVSPRKTNRYLLFDETLRLVGWRNTTTGEVRSPYPDLDPNRCQQYAFSGIHLVHPRIGALMTTWPERFPIMDFYLNLCDHLHIQGVCNPDLQLLDVGKQDSLKTAEDFLKTL